MKQVVVGMAGAARGTELHMGGYLRVTGVDVRLKKIFGRRPEQVEAADFVENSTEKDAVFLTGTQHNNFVSSLAGRRIVCGTSSWLYYHGFDTDEREKDISRFYADPTENMDVLEKYAVRYIVLDGDMVTDDTVDRSALETGYNRIYESTSGEIAVFAVPADMK